MKGTKPRRTALLITMFLFIGFWLLDRGVSSPSMEDSAWVAQTHDVSRFVEISGRKTRILDMGKGEPILLLHGWSDSTFTWRELLPRLEDKYRLIAFDWPGFGYSDKSHMPMSYPELASFAAEVAGTLGIHRFFVVGSSMGGAAALQLAADRPNLVRAMVLLDPAAGMDDDDGPVAKGVLLTPGLGRFAFFAMGRLSFELGLKTAVERDDLVTSHVIDEMYMPIACPGGRTAALLQLREIVEHPIARKLVERVSAPTLLLWGESDGWVPPDCGKRLASWLSHAELKLIPGSGHLPHWEMPDPTASAIREFLGRFHRTILSSGGSESIETGKRVK